MFGHVYLVAVIITAICVGIDASNLGARRGATGGGFLDMGAVAWAFSCLLWWISLVLYFAVHRPRLVARRNARAQLARPQPQPGYGYGYGYGHVQEQAPWTGTPTPAYTAPDGVVYSPDGYWWWDGTAWQPVPR